MPVLNYLITNVVLIPKISFFICLFSIWSYRYKLQKIGTFFFFFSFTTIISLNKMRYWINNNSFFYLFSLSIEVNVTYLLPHWSRFSLFYVVSWKHLKNLFCLVCFFSCIYSNNLVRFGWLITTGFASVVLFLYRDEPGRYISFFFIACR